MKAKKTENLESIKRVVTYHIQLSLDNINSRPRKRNQEGQNIIFKVIKNKTANQEFYMKQPFISEQIIKNRGSIISTPDLQGILKEVIKYEIKGTREQLKFVQKTVRTDKDIIFMGL